MNKIIKIEAGLIIFSIVSLILQLIEVKIGGILYGMGMGSLAIFYFVFTNFEDEDLDKLFKNLSRIQNRLGPGQGLSILIIGILFKTQVYAGAEIMLTVGLLATLIFLIIKLIGFVHKKKSKNKPVLIRLSIYLLLGVMIYLIPTYSIIDLRYRNEPEKRELLKKLHEDPTNDELREEWKELYENQED